MDNRRFGGAYPPLSEPVAPTNPERRELLRAPRQWMQFFEGALDRFMTTGESPDFETFIAQSNEYCLWANYHAEPTYQTLLSMRDSNPHNSIETHIDFHRHNRSMVFLWSDLFYPEISRHDSQSLLGFQQHMALGAVAPAQRLAILSKTGSPDDKYERNRINGHLTEIDTAITLMELMKDHPELVALPAPLRYENNRGNHPLNSDFLLFDRYHTQVRGIQVKSSVRTNLNVQDYDHDYVTLVDGSLDLGNRLFDIRQRLHVEQPGQIALSILADTPIKAAPDFIRPMEFMRHRQIAKELLTGRHSQLAMATRHVGYRVLHDLYLQPASEQAETEIV